MNVISVVVTNAGFEAVKNAQADGFRAVRLAQVGIGRGRYVADAERTSLEDEIKRIDTISGGVTGTGILHVSAIDSSADGYAAYEIGLYTEDGVLFAVHSQMTPIMSKVADSSSMFALDIVLTNVNPEGVEIGDTNFALAPAEHNRAGVVQLATQDEVFAATDDTKAITPLALLGAFAGVKGATGWRRLPTGLIVQWGSALVSPDGTRIVLPTAFPSACHAAVGQSYGTATVSLSARTRSTVTFTHNSDGGVTIDWIAIGE